MVTPFDAEGRVDEAGAARLMHHLVDHGSDGIVLGGSTGEASTMSDDELEALWCLGVDEVGDRVTIVAGTGSNDTRHAIHLTERATEAGVDAPLNLPGYYNRPQRRGVPPPPTPGATTTARPAGGSGPTTPSSRGPPTSRSSSTTSRAGPRWTSPTTF